MDINGLYALSSVFTLIIISIVLRKTVVLLRNSPKKKIAVALVTATGAYILLDALFVYCFLNQTVSLNIFRVVNLLFYIAYITLPLVWFLFSQSYIGQFSSRLVRLFLLIPYCVLLGMIATGMLTGCLFQVNDTVRYARGPLFDVFSTLNLFYYAFPVLRIIVILCVKRRKRYSYLFQVLLFSAIPLLGVFTNTYIIPQYNIYPFQPFCFVVGTLFAYFFLVEQQKSAEDEEKQRELEKALALKSEALQRARDAEQAKTTFLFNMSHDIRTPMNAVQGFIEIAQRNLDDPDKLRDALRKASSSGKHLLNIINDVLDMAQIESGRLLLKEEVVSIKEVWTSLKDMFADSICEKGISFITKEDIRDEFVIADRVHIQQIVDNLLGNAQKFTDPGGKIFFTISQTESDTDYAIYEIRVKDTGIGMSPEFQKRLFIAFERERTTTESGKQGTGLGLSIAKNLTDLMGGTLTFESTPGIGTEFILTLKLEVAKTPVCAYADTTDVQHNLQGKRLLLVEDNALNREIACDLLSQAGFVVDTVQDGAAAVHRLSASCPGDYDLVLMDIQMPNMDGYEATQAIRALEDPQLSRIPIVAMTANAFERDREKCLKAGMNDHIAKPVDIKKMTEVLAAVLNRA